ncbi:hypothetical protein C8R44DRAFT_738418 [Mycena epipterygia]|nr:hypothetical protein C8R44DRAFT_738418 [Mycena epipterygia]
MHDLKKLQLKWRCALLQMLMAQGQGGMRRLRGARFKNRSPARGNTRTAIKISAAVLRGRLEVVKATSATAESCVKADGLEATTVQKAEIENAEQLELMVNGMGALGSRVGGEIQPHHFFAFFPPTSRRDGAAGAQERFPHASMQIEPRIDLAGDGPRLFICYTAQDAFSIQTLVIPFQ